MKITNKYNLPQALVNAAEKHIHRKADISVTELINPVRQYWLKQRHWDEIEEDVSDMFWALLGTAFHLLMEQGADRNTLVEEYLVANVAGMELSGTVDLYSNNTIGMIQDWKTTSVYKILKGDFSDWEKQLNVYAYLFKLHGFDVDKLEALAALKDFSKPKSRREKKYPPAPLIAIPLPLWDNKITTDYIQKRIQLMKQAKDLPDDKLPLCSDEERWATPDIYAVMKKGRKSAINARITDQAEATAFALQHKDKDKLYIEYRKGESKRCNDYCPVKQWCSQYKEVSVGNIYENPELRNSEEEK